MFNLLICYFKEESSLFLHLATYSDTCSYQCELRLFYSVGYNSKLSLFILTHIVPDLASKSPLKLASVSF